MENVLIGFTSGILGGLIVLAIYWLMTRNMNMNHKMENFAEGVRLFQEMKDAELTAERNKEVKPPFKEGRTGVARFQQYKNRK